MKNDVISQKAKIKMQNYKSLFDRLRVTPSLPNRSKFKIVIIIVIVILVGFLVWQWVFSQPKSDNDSDLAGFAQCLTEKGLVMYGADWCSHCQREKSRFGEAFQFINYVECPQNPQKCLAAGIQGYPTWALDDGEKLVGEQGLEKLAQLSGCELTINN